MDTLTCKVAARFATRAQKSAAGGGAKALAAAVEKAFLALKPQLSSWERTPLEKAAKSYGKDAAEAFAEDIRTTVIRWATALVEQDPSLIKKEPLLKTLSMDHVQDTHEDTDYLDNVTYYSYEARFPGIVQVASGVVLDPAKITKRVLDDFSPRVELEDRHDAEKILTDPGVQHAIPGLAEEIAPKVEVGQEMSNALRDKVEEYAFQNMHYSVDSDDPDEVEVGVEAILKLVVDEDPGWKITSNGLTLRFFVTYSIEGEVLWPGDIGYREYSGYA